MSLTQTTTLTDSSGAVQTLHSSPLPFNYQSALNRLTIILDKYLSWNDPLSKRLIIWSAKVLPVDLTQEVTFGTEMLEYARERLQKLVNKILINPDGSALEEPVLERTWVWEKKILEGVKNFCNRSPYDGEVMAEIRPHFFAQEMLAWASSIPVCPPKNAIIVSPSIELVPAMNTRFDITHYLKVIAYCQLARNAMITQALRIQRNEVKRATVVAHQFLQEARELSRAEAELAERKAAAHEQAIDQRIDRIEHHHQTRGDVLQFKIENTEKKLESANASIKSMQNTNALQEENLKRLGTLNAALAHRVDELGKKPKKSKGSCAIQ